LLHAKQAFTSFFGAVSGDGRGQEEDAGEGEECRHGVNSAPDWLGIE
jgi:hypothetical protein